LASIDAIKKKKMTYQILKGNSLDLLPTLADNSIDAIVTDPPYGLGNPDPDYIIKAIQLWASGDRAHIPEGKGFMGKSWDSFVPPPAIWDECLRVLKPGGHLLAFAGTRTYDLMGISIRMAGFEIRDSIGWVYGSGFPKSLDVSKAIDKGTGENSSRQLRFTKWMRQSGLTSSRARDILFEAGLITEKSNQASHYFAETKGSQPAIATAEMFDALRTFLPEVPEEIERLVAERTGIEWTEYKNRKVLDKKWRTPSNKPEFATQWGFGAKTDGNFEITAPSTLEAQQWQGWGTALKPALEPIVVARKPLIGTVAENVLTHGTGGLNIDASRIGTGTGEKKKVNYPDIRGNNYQQGNESYSDRGTVEREVIDQGRWPANLILDEYTAELLDEQSGQSKSGNNKETKGTGGIWQKSSGLPVGPEYGDSGGASRFFYVAKASKRDRNEGLEDLQERQAVGGGGGVGDYLDDVNSASGKFGSEKAPAKNFHPTVKPTELMQYLVKLITPPGGTVLDPFTGSGSTGKAAILEGFDFIGIELTEDYWPIIEGRLKHAEAKVAEKIKETSAQEQEKLF
jgi:DNA modification methylase